MPIINITTGETIHIPKAALVLVPSVDCNVVNVPGFYEINGVTTLKVVDELSERAWQHISTGPLFRELWKSAVEDESGLIIQIPKTVDDLKKSGNGTKHIAGMIIEAVEKGVFEHKSLFFREPETHLHPKLCRTLMTLIYKVKALCTGKVETVEESLKKESTDENPS